MEQPIESAKLQPGSELEFMLSGRAIFTLVSMKTNKRYTYQIRKKDADGPNSKPIWFVSYLRGEDNENSYSYIGYLRYEWKTENLRFKLGKKITQCSTPITAFVWTFNRLFKKEETPNLEIWHAGRCGRCGRTLTVPESIQSGFGPECITKLRGA